MVAIYEMAFAEGRNFVYDSNLSSSLKIILNSPIDNTLSLVYIMTWHLLGTKL